MFFQPLGFAKYNKLSDKFSTKTLYILSQTAPRACYIPVFLYGILFKLKDGSRFFQNRIPMFPITAVWEIIYATFQGVSYISADEIRNECNDYIEWKTGTRNEATLSVASTVLCKIPQRLNNVITPKLKDWIGFDRNAYPEGRPQTESAQKWIFAMSTLIPAFLALTSILPMFGYKINKATRDRMYAELNERRSAKAEQITESEA